MRKITRLPVAAITLIALSAVEQHLGIASQGNRN